jgi:hypothetical protein
MNRTGDICSADADSVYVFFFACRLDDADAVCRRVFQRPLEALFSGELRCGDAPTIEAALNAFAQQAAEQTLPDYSGWLQARQEAQTLTETPAEGLIDTAAASAPSRAHRAGPALPTLSLDALRPPAAPRARPRATPIPFAVPLKARE